MVYVPIAGRWPSRFEATRQPCVWVGVIGYLAKHLPLRLSIELDQYVAADCDVKLFLKLELFAHFAFWRH
jgi:hypothetical protein